VIDRLFHIFLATIAFIFSGSLISVILIPETWGVGNDASSLMATAFLVIMGTITAVLGIIATVNAIRKT